MIVFQIKYSFSKTFIMSHIAPRWKNTTISIQKKLPPPPSSFHTSPTNAVAGGAQLQRALEIMASMDAEEAFEDHLSGGLLMGGTLLKINGWNMSSWRFGSDHFPF